MRRSSLPELAQSDLEELSTPALLARLKRLQMCEQSAEASDMSAAEVAEAAGIVFKNSDSWQRAHDEVRAVLATREHVTGSVERRAERRSQSGFRVERKDSRSR